MSALTAIEVAAAETAATASVKAALAAEQDKKHALETELSEARQKRARLQELEDRDAAIRLLDGDDVAPAKPNRATQIANLTKRIPALAAALPEQDNRIAALQRELATHRAPLVIAMFAVVSAIQEPAASSANEGLAALAPALSELLAADIVRAATIGDSFAIPDGCVPPFGGRVIVETFLKALPKRLRPPELDNDRLFAAARGRAAEILNQINGKEG